MNLEKVAFVLVGMEGEFGGEILDELEDTVAGLLDAYDDDGACVVAGLLRAALDAERRDPAARFAHAARYVADVLAYHALDERPQR